MKKEIIRFTKLFIGLFDPSDNITAAASIITTTIVITSVIKLIPFFICFTSLTSK